MVLLFRTFCAIVSNLLLVRCCSLTSNSREQEKVKISCFEQDSNDFFLEVESLNSLREVHLEGFPFSEKNVDQFSSVLERLRVQSLTLGQCSINSELIGHLSIPSSLTTIQLEKLVVARGEIQKIIRQLPSSLESFTILNCYCGDESEQMVLLNLSLFSSLRNITVKNLNHSVFDFYELLLSIGSIPLETLRLNKFQLTNDEWDSVLEKWTENINNNNNSAFKNLKVIEIQIMDICRIRVNQVINFLLAIPTLEEFIFNVSGSSRSILLSTFPPQLRRFELRGFNEIYEPNGALSIYSSLYFINHQNLTHLTINERVRSSFLLSTQRERLEFLDFLGITNKNSNPDFNFSNCDNLKELKAPYFQLAHALPQFAQSFSIIESLTVHRIDSAEFGSYFETILSSRTLKNLSLHFSSNISFNLKAHKQKLVSSIEKLELGGIDWRMICWIADNFEFPWITELEIGLSGKIDDFELDEMLEKIHPSFFLLTSLTLSGSFCQSKSSSSVVFEGLRSLKIDSRFESIDLNQLFSYMPNLIELELPYLEIDSKVILKSPISVRSVVLSADIGETDHFINFINNLPNLFQLKGRFTNELGNDISPIDLAFYLKRLRIHFDSELQFDIHSKCLPILLFKEDKELKQLIRLRSPKITDYLGKWFSLEKYKKVIKPLFIADVDLVFHMGVFDSLVPKIFELFGTLEMKNYHSGDIIVTAKIFLSDIKFFEGSSVVYSLDNLYRTIANYLTNEFKIALEDVHINFVKQFIEKNKKRSFSLLILQLQSYFSSITKINHANNSKVFQLFSQIILDVSFLNFFFKIKNNSLEEGEKETLLLVYPFNFENLSSQLRNLNRRQFFFIDIQLTESIYQLDKIKNFFERFVEFLKLFSIPKEDECSICMDPFLQKETKLHEYRGKQFCHLFHTECLDKWLAEKSHVFKNDCPLCRKGGSACPIM